MYRWGRIALITLVVFLAVLTVGKLKSLREPQLSYNSITVMGEGESIAVPDIATFSFSISSDAPSVAAAQEAVNKKMDAVMGALKNLGVAEKDVKTTDYSVYPKYVYSSGCISGYCPSQQKQDGYTVSTSVSVKVRDTAKAGDALAAAGTSGVTNLSSLSFTVDDSSKVSDEAMGKAIADARARAEVIAKQLGVRLVRVVGYYYNNASDGPMPYYREAAVSAPMDQTKSVSVVPGENKTSVSVSVMYEIR